MLASAKLQTIVLTARIHEAERFYTEALGLRVKRESHEVGIFACHPCRA